MIYGLYLVSYYYNRYLNLILLQIIIFLKVAGYLIEGVDQLLPVLRRFKMLCVPCGFF